MPARRQPTVLSLCPTFLREEAWHIYRQVHGVSAFRNVVVCRRRENEGQFPHEPLVRLRPPLYRGLWRLLFRASGHRVPLTPSEVGQLLRIRREHDAQLVHVYLGTEAMRALPYLRRETCPKIVSFHGADVSESFTAADFARLDACVDMFLCRSESLREALLQRGCKAEKIRLNRTGVPVPEIAPARPAPTPPYRLLQACRLIDKKGVDISIRALRMLLDRGMQVELTVAGGGPELSRLMLLARDLKLEGFIRFTGFLAQEQLLQEMRDAHLFLHPSRTTAEGDREGVPNAMLEAMAQALPVVATRHSGIPEAIQDGVQGLLVAEDDAVALADAVSRILADPDGWRSYGMAAYNRVHAVFSQQVCIANLESVYTEIITPGLD